jgi:hypothetical protein
MRKLLFGFALGFVFGGAVVALILMRLGPVAPGRPAAEPAKPFYGGVLPSH